MFESVSAHPGGRIRFIVLSEIYFYYIQNFISNSQYLSGRDFEFSIFRSNIDLSNFCAKLPCRVVSWKLPEEIHGNPLLWLAQTNLRGCVAQTVDSSIYIDENGNVLGFGWAIFWNFDPETAKYRSLRSRSSGQPGVDF